MEEKRRYRTFPFQLNENIQNEISNKEFLTNETQVAFFESIKSAYLEIRQQEQQWRSISFIFLKKINFFFF
jgi:hypothetical protein